MYYIENDLQKIKRIGREKEEENWEFRNFLKQIDLKTEEIDEIVHKINIKVTSQIDCKECANCCIEKTPVLDEKDILNFVKGLSISKNQFKQHYLKYDKEENLYKFESKSCPLLENNLCTNYEYRPESCRSYPHIDKRGFVSRLYGVLDNYSICPIVFNVYEILKIKLW